MLVNKINGPFNPKYEKLHLRAYLLGTVSDVEIEKKMTEIPQKAAPIQSASQIQK